MPAKKSPKKPFAQWLVEEQVRRINEALEPEVIPALEMDGGGLEILDIQGNKIFVQFYGACGNCGIASSATGPFIESTLKSQLGQEVEVIFTNQNQFDEIAA